MTTEAFLSPAADHDPTESLTAAQKETLQRAVAKIIALAARVGVTTDQMIQLLQSGLTVSELLDYLAGRSGEGA